MAGCVPSRGIPRAHSLFRKSHYGGRLCQTERVSRVNICLKGGGGGSSSSTENGSCRPGPSCSDRPLSVWA
ncbi:hypothetical protein PBY51_013669 [Eleginops maclovinus]|uniref:Uncharacterized protein n=1 Tax=Eleginops maclovinus TaxID=56733 RepID=A0AAN7Y723_ELEMC|nr:hypothetical protein PBY51_013669 [Eleginops maclovinus]